jgi:hypothetical protein
MLAFAGLLQVQMAQHEKAQASLKPAFLPLYGSFIFKNEHPQQARKMTPYRCNPNVGIGIAS